MIQAVRVVNPFGDDPLDLVLTKSHIDEGIYIKSITGIGPEGSTINTTALAMEDGGVFNSARSDNRNIVIELGFYESEKLHNSIEDSRQKTYKYFPKKKQIQLVFYTDNRTSFITGYVESNTPDIFSKEEATQISIICPDPNFYSMKPTAARFGGITEKFEFPFANDTVGSDLTFVGGIADNKQVILSDHSSITGEPGIQYFERTSDPELFDEWAYMNDLIRWVKVAEGTRIHDASLIMGEISQGSIHQINYNGDEDASVVMTIHFIGPATNIAIQNVDTNEMIYFNTDRIAEIIGSPIESGDDIILNTTPSSKSVVFRRYGIDYDILNAVDKEYLYNCWFKLHKGINQFTFIADTGFDNVKIRIDSYTAFNGI